MNDPRPTHCLQRRHDGCNFEDGIALSWSRSRACFTLTFGCPLHCEKKVQKKYRTFLVNNLPRHSVLKGVRKFCACFLWYFVQSLMGTTENMYRHSVHSPYSIFCAFSALKHGYFSGVLVKRGKTGSAETIFLAF